MSILCPSGCVEVENSAGEPMARVNRYDQSEVMQVKGVCCCCCCRAGWLEANRKKTTEWFCDVACLNNFLERRKAESAAKRKADEAAKAARMRGTQVRR